MPRPVDNEVQGMVGGMAAALFIDCLLLIDLLRIDLLLIDLLLIYCAAY
jgi:hypothetical protein